MVNPADRVECTHLYPSHIKFRHFRIIVDIAAVAGNVRGRERDESQACRKQDGNLVLHLRPALGDPFGASAVTGPAKGVFLKTCICCPGHLEHSSVWIAELELLLDDFVPGEAVNIVDFRMHAVVVLHVEPFDGLFVAPGRLSHISPEPGCTIVQRFLLVCSPPCGNFRIGEIHDSAVPAPRPWHVIALACPDILHEVAKAVSLFPLPCIRL